MEKSIEMDKIDSISVEIEPFNDQSIVDNEHSKGLLSGGDPIDLYDKAEVIILK